MIEFDLKMVNVLLALKNGNTPFSFMSYQLPDAVVSYSPSAIWLSVFKTEDGKNMVCTV